jgi:hypothetical protein
MIGIGSCATDYYSCFDQLLSFDDWTTGLGECCIGNPCWIIFVTFWAIGGHFWTETGFACCSCCSCSWWSCVWSKLSYVRPLNSLILDMCFILVGQCRALLVPDSFQLASVSSQHYMLPVPERIASLLRLAHPNLSVERSDHCTSTLTS